MDSAQMMNVRSKVLEQYAQIQSELDLIRARRHHLKKRASMLLDDLRQVTAQINQSQAQNPAPQLVEA